MNKPQKHYPERNKSYTKDYVFYGFIYMKFQEKAKLWR